MIALPDGVYAHLSPDRYFGQDRLGSTDLTTLHNRPADWWYGSRHNPHRPPREPSPEMEFGSALHALLLEGEDAYLEATVLSPYEDYRTREAREWREGQRAQGRLILTEDMDRRVRHMTALIRNHPELGEPMSAGMSEVSVLWSTEDGIKLRARFDKLLPRFSIDLKSYGGDTKGVSLTQECMGLVASRHMDVQRFIYWEARQKMAQLIADGHLYGATADEADWLRKVSAVEDWRWLWLFYRRQDDQKGLAPMVKPIMRSHDDSSFRTGQSKVAVALQNYRTFRDRFGFDTPWAVIEAAEEPADHEFPPWLNHVREPVTFPPIHSEAA